jgi:hypothetical protein
MHKFPMFVPLYVNSRKDDVPAVVFESKSSLNLMVGFFIYLLRIPDAATDLIYIQRGIDFLKLFLRRNSEFIGMVEIDYRTYCAWNASLVWAEKGPRIQFPNRQAKGWRKIVEEEIKLIFEYSPYVFNEEIKYIMPHMELIEKAGGLFKHLRLSNFDMVESGPSSCDDDGFVGIVKDENYLQHVLSNCPSEDLGHRRRYNM